MAETRVVTLQGTDGEVNFVANVSGEDFGTEGIDRTKLPSVDDLWRQVHSFAGGAWGVIQAVQPTKFAVELSAGLEGEQGWVLGHASVSGSVTISLEWTKPDPKTP